MSNTRRNDLATTPYRTPAMKSSIKSYQSALDWLGSYCRNRDKVLANIPIKGYDKVYCSAYRETYNTIEGL